MEFSFRQRTFDSGDVVLEPVLPIFADAKEISTRKHDALIDTGSHKTYFRTSFKLRKPDKTLGGAGGEKILCEEHRATLTFFDTHRNMAFQWQADVYLTNDERVVRNVLGYHGFLEHFVIQLNYPENSLIIDLTDKSEVVKRLDNPEYPPPKSAQ